MLPPAERAIAATDVDIGEAEAQESLLGRLGEGGNPLDRVDLGRDTTQKSGRVPRASPHFEDPLAAVQAELLNRERDDIRLGDRLPFADRQRRVLVGKLGEIFGDEGLPRDAPERVEDLGIRNSPAREVSIDHAHVWTLDIDHRSDQVCENRAISRATGRASSRSDSAGMLREGRDWMTIDRLRSVHRNALVAFKPAAAEGLCRVLEWLVQR